MTRPVARPWLLPLMVGLVVGGCAMRPVGPSVMVLPGTGKGFEQFQYDDAVCQQWASQQTGTTPSEASTNDVVGGAAIGTALGAAAGAAVGAASGSPATGAAVGSGIGLLGGTAVGSGYGSRSAYWVQQRFDTAYMQCMYAKGNRIPVSAPFQQWPSEEQQGASTGRPPDVPPPPAGRPPPPPPGAAAGTTRPIVG